MEAKKVWFADEKIFILTDKNEELWQSLLWYPRLLSASPEEREKFRLNAFGIRWDELDEDISFESFTYEQREPENPIADVFKKYPINVSEFARQMGIPRSLMANYITGNKKPSGQRKKDIENALRELGKKLAAISL